MPTEQSWEWSTVVCPPSYLCGRVYHSTAHIHTSAHINTCVHCVWCWHCSVSLHAHCPSTTRRLHVGAVFLLHHTHTCRAVSALHCSGSVLVTGTLIVCSFVHPSSCWGHPPRGPCWTSHQGPRTLQAQNEKSHFWHTHVDQVDHRLNWNSLIINSNTPHLVILSAHHACNNYNWLTALPMYRVMH